MKTIALIFVLCLNTFLTAQTYTVEKISGSVKVLADEEWVDINTRIDVNNNSIIMTGENSSAKITGENLSFILNESAALPVSGIKKMTLDELLLALALDDIMNAPRKKEKSNGKNTAVYGTREDEIINAEISLEDFGTRRLNGAVQLAENGMGESAVITAREVYRKYPSAGEMPFYRIYFADILYSFKLYEEAYNEFNIIKNLALSKKETSYVESRLNELGKMLIRSID